MFSYFKVVPQKLKLYNGFKKQKQKKNPKTKAKIILSEMMKPSGDDEIGILCRTACGQIPFLVVAFFFYRFFLKTALMRYNWHAVKSIY